MRAGGCDSRPTRSPAPLRRRPWSPCCCNDCDGIRASSRFGGESTPAISIRSGGISASPTCGPIVLWFSAILPLVLPVYVLWLYSSVGEVSITFLLTVFLGLCALDVILCVVTCIPLRFWPYVPYYVIVQNLVMKPLR